MNLLILILLVILIILGLFLFKNYEHFVERSVNLNDSDVATVRDPTLTLAENKTTGATDDARDIVNSYLITYGPNNTRYGFKNNEVSKAFPNVRIVSEEVTNLDMVPILWQCCNKLQENVSYYKTTISKLEADLKKANESIGKIEKSDKDKLISGYKKEIERLSKS